MVDENVVEGVSEEELITRVLLGNKSAIHFCQMVFNISQVWDDIVDGDKNLSNKEVNRAFTMALIDIPYNRFYQDHSSILVPKMSVFISDWLDANELAKEDGNMLMVSHVLRDSVSSLLIHCAELVGGYDHARNVAVMVRKHAHTESFERYKDSVKR